MLTTVRRFATCLLIVGLAACAQGGPPAPIAAAAPIDSTAPASSPAVATTATGKLACLDNPNYDTMPLPPSGRRGRVAQWLARPDGSGCHWTRAGV